MRSNIDAGDAERELLKIVGDKTRAVELIVSIKRDAYETAHREFHCALKTSSMLPHSQNFSGTTLTPLQDNVLNDADRRVAEKAARVKRKK